MADTKDLKSFDPKDHEGSTPSPGTNVQYDELVDFTPEQYEYVANRLRFRNMPVHICDKVYPKSMPYLIPKDFEFCPFCGAKIQ